VLVGTFNPSGNRPEDPDVIRIIGDQDRGHNLLYNISDPVLVDGLYGHAEHIINTFHGPWERYLPRNNKVVTSGKTRILFFPRSKWTDFNALFTGLESGNTLRIAVSHLNDSGICKLLFALAGRGVHIEIIAHDTLRRVPQWVEEQMLRHEIVFHRYGHPEDLPMHNKFMLIDAQDRHTVAFGSMNLSVRSLRANHELLVVCEEQQLYQAFHSRWDDMRREIETLRAGP
jgi:phosphatidylserine/phosphatidylglycerophosphate/cardiolipin synthase-like enzyme